MRNSRFMRLAILYPLFVHPAIEERYGSWQSQLFLRRAESQAQWITYRPDEPIGDVASRANADFCLVVTDPLLLVGTSIVASLSTAFTTGIAAVVPMTNEGGNDAQHVHDLEPYLTIRQFQEIVEARAMSLTHPPTLVWNGDPGLYLSSTAFLRNVPTRASDALNGQVVAISPKAYVHRWTRLRSQPRADLLPFIPQSASSMLEFGCAEGLLGETLKLRQMCRYVGIEIDPLAAAAAEKRLDHVYLGDATELVSTIAERFDCIIGGDVLEHLADPWSFLIRLRELATDGGLLLLSIPNVANWAIIADLLQGRFDYAYIAIACAGHLRFFGRNTITDALEIAGWTVESIEPQTPIINGETARFLAQLGQSDIQHDAGELVAPGFYVRARNVR